MRKLFLYSKQKSKGQAAVEFALALPVLLLILFGMMETGRLLFIYASTVTAARQAARYGSATGISPNNVPYYQDCAGINAAANQIGFLTHFTSINIAYDAGVTDANNDGKIDSATENTPLNPPNPACGAFITAVNGDRVKVTVTAQWVPVVPLVPLRPFVITSTSERTILASVDIAVTGVSPTFAGTGGNPSLTMASSTETYNTLNQTITYTYTLVNIGSSKLMGPFTITDPNGKVSITSCNPSTPPASLAANSVGSYVCTGTYHITQADLNAGYVTNLGASTDGAGIGATASKTIFAVQSGTTSLAKTVAPDYAAAGATVTYSYVITNTGNVTMKSYSITDNRLGAICAVTGDINPGNTVTCTKTYTVTAADVNAGQVDNTANSTSVYKLYDASTGTLSNANALSAAVATLITEPLNLKITAAPATMTTYGQVITIKFWIRNNTTGTLSNPKVNQVSFTGKGAALALPLSCGNVGSGSTVTCTVTYTVTQADLDQGSVVLVAYVRSASGETSRNTTLTIPLTPDPKLAMTFTVSPTTATAASRVITYNYVITNPGNVSLTSVALGDPALTGINCSGTTLATLASTPGAKITCTATRTITDDELNYHSYVTSTSTATAMYLTTSAAPATVTPKVWTSSAPRLKLDITAPASIAGEGATITFTYKVTNTGTSTFTAPFTFTGYIGTAPSCAASTLAPETSTTCTGTYLTTEADATAGVVSATVTVTAGGTVSNSVAVSVAVTVPTACIVKHTTLTVSTSAMGMSIVNTNAFLLRISSFDITHSDKRTPPHQFVKDISVGGVSVWSNVNTNYDSPYTISGPFTNTASLVIPANTTAVLSMSFKQKYGLNGSERIVVHFSSLGCTGLSLDSKDATQLQ